MEQLLPEENKWVQEKIRVHTLSTSLQCSSWRPFFKPCSGAGFEVGGLVESANKGQTAKVQAVNEILSSCLYFLLPSLLNCTLFFLLRPPLHSFQVHRYAFSISSRPSSLLFYCLIFQQYSTFLLSTNPPYIYLSPTLFLPTFFSLGSVPGLWRLGSCCELSRQRFSQEVVAFAEWLANGCVCRRNHAYFQTHISHNALFLHTVNDRRVKDLSVRQLFLHCKCVYA